MARWKKFNVGNITLTGAGAQVPLSVNCLGAKMVIWHFTAGTTNVQLPAPNFMGGMGTAAPGWFAPGNISTVDWLSGRALNVNGQGGMVAMFPTAPLPYIPYSTLGLLVNPNVTGGNNVTLTVTAYVLFESQGDPIESGQEPVAAF